MEETKGRYIGWGPDYNSWFNSKSKWSYWVFKKPLSKLKRISKELSEQVDDLLINVESAPYVDDALAGLNSERIRTDCNLADIKTLLHTKVPTTRYEEKFVKKKRRAKNSCFQGQYGRATKALASDGFPPVNKATLDGLKKLHPTAEKPILVQNFSSQAYQFSEEKISEQLTSFSRSTAAVPSKMFPEHLLHAV